MVSQYLTFVNIGFGHAVCVNKVKYLTLPKTAPGFRIARIAKREGRFVDATCGKTTKTLIVLDDNTVLACAFTPATTITRFRKACFEFIDDASTRQDKKDWREQYRAQLLLSRHTSDDISNDDGEDEEVVDVSPEELKQYEVDYEQFDDDDYNPPPGAEEPDDEDADIPDEYDDEDDGDVPEEVEEEE